MGEKFSVSPATGTAELSIPIPTSPARSGFGPQFTLTYDSGAGNGPFGLGWSLQLPAISRKTDKGLPRYDDGQESDVFMLSGAEDLVPTLDDAGEQPPPDRYTMYGSAYLVQTFRPRVEGRFALIERWTQENHPENVFWRTITPTNLTSWYGRTPDSRILDPDHPEHIFQWLICEAHDDKGDAIVYDYAREDGAGVLPDDVAESNRTIGQQTANCYPKHIRYGNLKPFLPMMESAGARWFTPDAVPNQGWMFEVVFDYGDHRGPEPRRLANAEWLLRTDPFSSYRSGFEIRTYRLCRRVLMFHHFAGVTDVGSDCLVRSTDFDFREPGRLSDPEVAGYTVLRSITQRSYQRRPARATGYEFRDRPPVTFTYTEPRVNRDVRAIPAGELENLPVGIQGAGFQWLDLDGEGIAGVLAQQTGAWYFKAGTGDGRFAPLRLVAERPALAATPVGLPRFIDLAGDGQLDLVELSGPTPGFHERDEGGWTNFVAFASLPAIDWNDSNLRFVDLTGDGLADALITDQDVFTWYASLDERGFDRAIDTRLPEDDNAGPRLVFSDSAESIFMADLSGDGLADVVRIRNGDVCYWPNIGYGRFGRKITLGNSPRFDHEDLFDPGRIRLVDIDGSGPSDLIYLGRDGAQLYFNRSGNSLSDALVVDLPIATENLPAVQVADLLGNGTACLVWNSALPADTRTPTRYIDLMGGGESAAERRKHEKPHLLIGIDNGLGGTTAIEYTPSTRFYVADKLAGAPWITRLPFPVHCVSRTTVRDVWRGTSFSSTFSYHHGYFDGIEREFRGFGRVDQIDVEDYGTFAQANAGSPFITPDRTLYQPPVKTVTWYHTGAALDRARILTQFASEYFPAGFRITNGFFEKPLPEPELPAALSAHEWREALRACKGMVLRQESYELDVDDLAATPSKESRVRLFSSATHNCRIHYLQRKGVNRHAVFLVTESEALTYQYELALPARGGDIAPDPRVAHMLNLRFDQYANPEQSIAIGYQRFMTGLPPGLPATAPSADLVAQVQSERLVAYTETRYTGDVIVRAAPMAGHRGAIRHRRLRLPCEVLTYEVTGLATPVATYFDIDEMRRHAFSDNPDYPPVVPDGLHAEAVTPLEYHERPRRAGPHHRLVERVRSLYFRDEDGILSPSLPHAFGSHGPRGLKFEDYKLASTDSLLDAVFRRRDRTGRPIDTPLLDLETEPGISARDVLTAPAATAAYLRSGYISGSEIDATLTGQYWMRSGRAGFSPDAASHFYLPERYTDPFGATTTLSYDARDLFVESSTDPLGNVTRVERFDYRVLAPRETVDVNDNHSEVAFDTLGLVVAIAAKGKPAGNRWEGDDLAAFDLRLCNPAPADIRTFFAAQTLDVSQAEAWLARATSRFVYHFGDSAGWGSEMATSCVIHRERHAPEVDADPQHDNPLQVALECSDGGGNLLMKKIQAEPAIVGGPLRWIINGRLVLNNKRKPVKQYEPAFTPNFRPELPPANGTTSVMYYDSEGRLVRTEFPDGTFSRVEYGPWHVRTFDQNDTALESTWYARLNASADPAERGAARRAAKHASTPALAILDSLGRQVIAIGENARPAEGPQWTATPLLNRPWVNAFTGIFTRLDAEGKPLWIRDARGNLVVQHILPHKADSEPGETIPAGAVPCYDVAGNLLFEHSMDAGDRWTLADVTGAPLLSWDINTRGAIEERRLFHAAVDALHRPTELWMRVNANTPVLLEAFEYLDTARLDPAGLTAAKDGNRIGQTIRHYDPSGLSTIERVSFDGAVEEVTRTLIDRVDGALVDWNVANRQLLLEADTFRQLTHYDALGRPAVRYGWHRDRPAQAGRSDRVAVYVPSYNRRGVLESEMLHVRATKQTDANGRVSFTPHPDAAKNVRAIQRVTWNEKGQRLTLELANGTVTRYTYDPDTYRLSHLFTRRDGRFPTDCAGSPDAARPARPCGVQNLHFVYDAVGNITHVHDDAQDTIWFANQQVEPSRDFIYDALYRLIAADGRENAAAVGSPIHAEGNWPTGTFPPANMTRRYTERYSYDDSGNITQVNHQAGAGSWTRYYDLASDNNRLTRTWYGDPDWNSGTANTKTTYRHDPHGNLLNLADTLPGTDVRWDWRDTVGALNLLGGGWAYYSHDTGKVRTRKRLVRNGGGIEDRISLNGYELYRRRTGQGTLVEEIESLHLFEGEQRVLLVDDVIRATATAQPGPSGLTLRQQTLFRYQYSNHLGSACSELDQYGQVISHEEYHPYGTAAYRLMESAREAPAKRYRYAGMERDEESGLNYHRARYYSPLIARWISADPTGTAGGANGYEFVLGNPLALTDTDGEAPKKAGLVPEATVSQWFEAILQKFNWAYEKELKITVDVGGQPVNTIPDYFAHPPARPQELIKFEIKIEHPGIPGSASEFTPEQLLTDPHVEAGKPFLPNRNASNISLLEGKPTRVVDTFLVFQANVHDEALNFVLSRTEVPTVPFKPYQVRKKAGGGAPAPDTPAVEAGVEPAAPLPDPLAGLEVLGVPEGTANPAAVLVGELAQGKLPSGSTGETGSATIDTPFSMFGVVLTAYALYQTKQAFDRAYRESVRLNSQKPLEDEAIRQGAAWGLGLGASIALAYAVKGTILGGAGGPGGVALGFFVGLFVGVAASYAGHQLANEYIEARDAHQGPFDQLLNLFAGPLWPY